jgi:hypothetical protein
LTWCAAIVLKDRNRARNGTYAATCPQTSRPRPIPHGTRTHTQHGRESAFPSVYAWCPIALPYLSRAHAARRTNHRNACGRTRAQRRRGLIATNAWNDYNYVLESQQALGRDDAALKAIAEALGWARAHVMIARTPGQSGSSDSAIFVTRWGHAAVEEGLRKTRAAVRLSSGLHPEIERRARPQFLLGEPEQAVFVAMKSVEVRVRKLASLTDLDFGVDLMNKAFGPTGALTDATAARGEQDGTRSLFRRCVRGAAQPVWPPGHRLRRCRRGCRSGHDR